LGTASHSLKKRYSEKSAIRTENENTTVKENKPWPKQFINSDYLFSKLWMVAQAHGFENATPLVLESKADAGHHVNLRQRKCDKHINIT
jgi:hypothetical protein